MARPLPLLLACLLSLASSVREILIDWQESRLESEYTLSRNQGTADEEASLSTHLKLACTQLLDGVQEHVRTEVSAEVKQQLHSTAFVGGLARHGVELEEQVRWFALANLGLIRDAVEADGPKHAGASTIPASDVEVGAGKPSVDELEGEIKVLKEQLLKVGQKEAKLEANVLHNTKVLKSIPDGMRYFGTSDEVGQTGTSLERFLWLTKDKADKASVLLYHAAWKELKRLAAVKKPTLPKPLSETNETAYRKSLISEQGDHQRWATNMAKVLEEHVEFEPNSFSTEEKLEKLRELFEGLMKIRESVGSMAYQVRKSRAVDWPTVGKEVSLTRWQAIVKWVKDQVKQLFANIRKRAKSVWKAFLAMVQKSEEKCEGQHRKKEEEAMKDQGMRSSDDMAKLVMEKGDKQSEDVFEEELHKADKLLSKVDTHSPETEEKLKREAVAVQTAGKMLEKDARTGVMTEGDVEKLDERMKKVDTAACEAKEWWLTRQLRKLFAMAKRLLDRTTPLMGIRGFGGTASVFGGGIEEVIDFWNKEIGVYAWGSTNIGMAAASSITLGGYAGVGWKGYKLDYNLQDAHQHMALVSWNPTLHFPLPVPFMHFSLGGSVSMDLDTTSFPWVMDKPGLTRLAIGWSLAVGLKEPSPLSTLSFGAMAHTAMFTSECYNTLSEFLKAIWLPHCKDCVSLQEKLAWGALRSSIKVAAFPVLSDIIYSFLAVRVDKLRREERLGVCAKENRTRHMPCLDGSYNPDLDERFRCSPKSTRYRHNLTEFGALTAAQIEAAVHELGEVHKEAEKLLDAVEESQNDEALLSPEMTELVTFLKGTGAVCPTAPAEEMVTLATNLTIKKVTSDALSLVRLKDMTKDQLEELCKSRPACEDRMGWLYDTKEQLIRYLDGSSKENPYGTCSKQEHCPDQSMQCDCGGTKSLVFKKLNEVRKLVAASCPGHTGHCRCAEGYCWVWPKGCVPAKVSGERLGVAGLRAALAAWIFQRKLELGSHAAKFTEIVGVV